jgi:hypothetical protein
MPNSWQSNYISQITSVLEEVIKTLPNHMSPFSVLENEAIEDSGLWSQRERI